MGKSLRKLTEMVKHQYLCIFVFIKAVASASVCKYGDWTKWGSCKILNRNSCQKVQTRIRRCTGTKADIDSGCCEKLGPSSQLRNCTPSYDIEWSSWSACSATCGNNGRKTREMIYLDPKCNRKPETEIETCPSKPCLKNVPTGNAPNEDDYDVVYDYGISKRTKMDLSILSVADMNAVINLLHALGVTVPRKDVSLPVQWSEWGSCIYSQNDSEPCQGKRYRYKANEDQEDTNCPSGYNEWTQWESPLGNGLSGTGYQVRMRLLKENILYKGSCSDMVENRTIQSPPTPPPPSTPTPTSTLPGPCVYKRENYGKGEKCYSLMTVMDDNGNMLDCPVPYEQWSNWTSQDNGVDVRTRRMSSSLSNFKIEFNCNSTETDKRPTPPLRPYPIIGCSARTCCTSCNNVIDKSIVYPTPTEYQPYNPETNMLPSRNLASMPINNPNPKILQNGYQVAPPFHPEPILKSADPYGTIRSGRK